MQNEEQFYVKTIRLGINFDKKEREKPFQKID
jgi:hypothetical protein